MTEENLGGGDLPAPQAERNANPKDGFANSAHPPIHALKIDLDPEEFELVFRANRAESLVYRIVSANQGPDKAAVLTLYRLTLYRKQTHGRRQAGLRFEALKRDHEHWMLDAPIFGEDFHHAVENDPDLLMMLAETVTGEIRFEVEDCLGQAGRLPFARLLHLMKAARLGRPSTYAATLKRLFEDSTVVTLDRASGAVCLTQTGAELGARLQTRCNELTSKDFARMFDQKLNAVAARDLTPQQFLTWVIGLACPSDALATVAAAKLWTSVDELRADRIDALNPLEGNGGFISPPVVGTPRPMPPLPCPDPQ